MKRTGSSNVARVLLAAAAVALAAHGPGRGPGAAWADESGAVEAFTFDGRGCMQTVSNIQAPLEKVAPYLDPRFHCSREELGACMVAYRMFSCPAFSLGGSLPRAVIWTELGVRVRPPNSIPNTDHIDTHALDGHDYYVIFFHTNDAELAQRFADAGAPGLYVPDLSFSVPPSKVPVPFEGLERVPGGGTYQVTVEALFPEDVSLALGDVILETGAFPPFHLNGYYARADGAIVRYREYRTNVTGHLSSYRIEHDAETPLGQMTDRTETTFADAFVHFDIEAGVEVFDDPDCVFDPLCNPANLPHLPVPGEGAS